LEQATSLSTYFVVAYAASWSVGVPLALQAQGVVAWELPWALHVRKEAA
jgi:hypothetical protein